ncbi:MAG: glycerol-3-phosphate acyltransferase [Gammaproteobacteria bacterium]|nr:glycerol-3-phosphate acyltransferase [Gammaproteobacteria bacterium]
MATLTTKNGNRGTGVAVEILISYQLIVPILFILGGYLWGSVPVAFLVARYKSGIDLRQYGSGNVGATNLMEHSGKVTGFVVGMIDALGKGTVPVILANLLGQELWVQAGVGLAAICGHNWSLVLRFTGGRGVATAIGVILGFQMWPESIITAIVLGWFGRFIFRDTGFWTFISLLILPALAFVFGRPAEVIAMTGVLGVLLISKRVTANWEPLFPRYPWYRVIGYRVLWDRDVPRKEEWTERRPISDNDGPLKHVPD